MSIYYLLFLLPAIPCAVLIKGKHLNYFRETAIVIFFALLLFLSAFRATSVGTDTINYKMMFSRFAGWSFERVFTYKEPAFALLCKLISLVTDNFQWLVVIVAVITITPIFMLYYSNIEYPMLTIALFVTMSNFYMLFSGMRQSIAISLGVIAYLLTQKKKLVGFLLFSILAILFHRSAFVLLLMYPMYHIRLTKKSLFFVVPVMALIFIFNQQIFSFLRSFINDYESIGQSNTGAVSMLLLFILFSVFSFVIADEKDIDDNIIGMRNMLLVATAFQMFAPLNTFAMRIGYYYMVFIPLIIPLVIKNRSIRMRQFALVAHYLMIIFFIARFILTASSDNALDIFPYHFFWER